MNLFKNISPFNTKPVNGTCFTHSAEEENILLHFTDMISVVLVIVVNPLLKLAHKYNPSSPRQSPRDRKDSKSEKSEGLG